MIYDQFTIDFLLVIQQNWYFCCSSTRDSHVATHFALFTIFRTIKMDFLSNFNEWKDFYIADLGVSKKKNQVECHTLHSDNLLFLQAREFQLNLASKTIIECSSNFPTWFFLRIVFLPTVCSSSSLCLEVIFRSELDVKRGSPRQHTYRMQHHAIC